METILKLAVRDLARALRALMVYQVEPRCVPAERSARHQARVVSGQVNTWEGGLTWRCGGQRWLRRRGRSEVTDWRGSCGPSSRDPHLQRRDFAW